MSLVDSLKREARQLPEALGFGHRYFHQWWTRAGASKGMITPWNRRHNAIFVHVPKTAGMSIAEMFAMERPADYHAPACAYRAADPAFFASALKFAVVRNPWDRLVSAYHYSLTSSPIAEEREWGARYLAPFDGFEPFVRALRGKWFRTAVFQRQIFMPQYYFLSDPGGALAVDRLLPFEHLADGVAEIARELRIELRDCRVNDSRHGFYTEYYSPEAQAIVAEIYHRDIADFGYEFGVSPPLGAKASEPSR